MEALQEVVPDKKKKKKKQKTLLNQTVSERYTLPSSSPTKDSQRNRRKGHGAAFCWIGLCKRKMFCTPQKETRAYHCLHPRIITKKTKSQSHHCWGRKEGYWYREVLPMRVDQPLYLLQSIPPKNLLERAQRRNGKGRTGEGGGGQGECVYNSIACHDDWPLASHPCKAGKGATCKSVRRT